jgi:hypothetical protein
MGMKAPSADGPDVGGVAFVRVKGSDDDDGPSPGVMGMGMAMLPAAAPESDGCTPVSNTVELGASARDAEG